MAADGYSARKRSIRWCPTKPDRASDKYPKLIFLRHLEWCAFFRASRLVVSAILAARL